MQIKLSLALIETLLNDRLLIKIELWLFCNHWEISVNSYGNCDIGDDIVLVTDKHIIAIIIRYTHTHTHTHIYIYIYIYIDRFSCRRASLIEDNRQEFSV